MIPLNSFLSNARRRPALDEKLGPGPFPWDAACALGDALRPKGEVSFYGLRHKFCTDLLKRNVNPVTVAALLGHQGLDCIMNYANTLKDDTALLHKEVLRRTEATERGQPV